jgi:hypothetical protein
LSSYLDITVRNANGLQIANNFHHLAAVVSQYGKMFAVEVRTLVDEIDKPQQGASSAPLQDKVKGVSHGRWADAMVDQSADTRMVEVAENHYFFLKLLLQNNVD